MKKDRIRKTFEETIALLVNKENNRPVRASMIESLGKTADTKYASLYEKNIYDSSYSVAGAALEALSKTDSVLALKHAMELAKKPAKGKLDKAINAILVASGKEEVFDKLADKFSEMGLTNEKFMLMQQIGEMTGSMKSNERIKKSIDLITSFRDEIPSQVKEQTTPYINGMILGGIMNKLKLAGNTEMVKYLESKLGK
jgi:aminopeptidase N